MFAGIADTFARGRNYRRSDHQRSDTKSPKWQNDLRDCYKWHRHNFRQFTHGDGKMIYFIQEEKDGAIKIGYAKWRASARLRHLQIANPHKLYLLGVMEGEKSDEKKLHVLFKKYRIRGEWFCSCKKLLNYIRENCHANEKDLSSNDDRHMMVQFLTNLKEDQLEIPSNRVIYGRVDPTGCDNLSS